MRQWWEKHLTVNRPEEEKVILRPIENLSTDLRSMKRGRLKIPLSLLLFFVLMVALACWYAHVNS